MICAIGKSLLACIIGKYLLACQACLCTGVAAIGSMRPIGMDHWTPILILAALLVVAIVVGWAINIAAAQRDSGSGRAVLSDVAARVAPYLWQRPRAVPRPKEPSTPDHRSEFLDRKAVGVRVTLYLTVPIVILAGYVGGKDWGLVMVLVAPFSLLVTLPLSVAHTYLLAYLKARGLLVSTAAGLLLGLIAGIVVPEEGLAKVSTIYGGVYGFIIGLGHTSLLARSHIADSGPRTLKEQARIDGL